MNYADFGVSGPDELEQDEWSLTKPTFETPKGAVLTVVGKVWGFDPVKMTRLSRYVFYCPSCAEDTELFGDGVFTSTKGGLVRGQRPCGCSKKRVLSESQTLTLILRVAKELGVEMNGYVGGVFINYQTKLHMLCPKHGQYSTTTIANFLNKQRGCSGCVVDKSRTRNTLPSEVSISKFLATGKFHPETIFVKKEYPLWEVICPICSQDKYARAGTGRATFEAHHSSLLKGAVSCRCNNTSYRWQQQEREHQIKERLEELFYKGAGDLFVGWVKGEYKNKYSKFKYLCPIHGEVESRVDSFINQGCGCNKCGEQRTSEKLTDKTPDKTVRQFSTEQSGGLEFIRFCDGGYKSRDSYMEYACPLHGVKTMKVGNFLSGKGCPECKGQSQRQCYIHQVSDQGTPVAIKFGIAKDWLCRLKAQNKKNLFQVKNIGVWGFETAESCKVAERWCKKTLHTKILSPREMPDGWTETVSVLDLEKVIAIYEKHGGVRIK